MVGATVVAEPEQLTTGRLCAVGGGWHLRSANSLIINITQNWGWGQNSDLSFLFLLVRHRHRLGQAARAALRSDQHEPTVPRDLDSTFGLSPEPSTVGGTKKG